MRSYLICGVLLGLVTGVLSAQSLISDEELPNRLQGQAEALGERTRSVSIVTGSGSTGAAATGEAGLTSLEDIKNGTIASVVLEDGSVRVSADLEINIRIQFKFDRAALAASEQPALNQMCRVMQKAEDVGLFQIVGHTDSAGSDAYNKRLSQLRAEEVQRNLVNDCGIAASRLRVVGYGEEFPDNEADTRAPEGRWVELQVIG